MVKCTRCGRSLKKAFIVNGAPYGPVCVRKLFGLAALQELLGKKPRAKKPAVPEGDSEQGQFFATPPVLGKVYEGVIRNPGTPDEEYVIIVSTDSGLYRQIPLEESLVHQDHSPTGFCWGYGGSGPAQTAFAILLDYLNGDVERVRGLYQDFKFKFVSGWDMNGPWRLEGKTIENFITLHDIDMMQKS